MNDFTKKEIAILGLGYVGLHLAILFVHKGFKVIGIDIDIEKINKLKKGESYLSDISKELIIEINKSNLFEATNEFKSVENVEACILCIPTPLLNRQTPDLSYIRSTIKSITPYLSKRKLIILESSTYPGTTEEVILPMLEKENKKIGTDFHLAYSPERIDPGNKKYQLEDIPKVISGVTYKCCEKIKYLYSKVFNKTIIVSSPKVAEMTKLLENTQRFINISLINEIAIISNKLGINIWEVIEAANTKPFGFVNYTPGPGIGGHCIPVDPLYLSWKANECGIDSKFIRLSNEINTQMPNYVVERITNILSAKGLSMTNSKILLIGMTYKKDINDLRESPSTTILRELLKLNIIVSYHDPLVNKLEIDTNIYEGIELSEKVLINSDCVVILTNHSNINYDLIIEYAPLVFDTRFEIKGDFPNVVYL
ncbi:nucleotide sugar dehydrogenase [Sutcliffiella halmapala]|uniref:nucleotide sugar dehydrogenase n=1 Tax=Sutcliffiella halmapala TaxID=79882 RepID=UPI00099543AE|nr:nucleotide sugar dehydrogenase [Sutcliffiella halmapala]